MNTRSAQNRKKTGSHLFKPGQSGNPKGRKRGVPNKLTGTARENIQAVYGALGDIAGHVKFLQTHPLALADFYNNVYPRLLPLDVNHGGSVESILRFEFASGHNGNGNGNGHA